MPVPVINIAQMREWEKATWATGQTEAEVIRRVGVRIAQLALRVTRSGNGILILAGKGHNGDDARAAREHLPGRHVETLDVSSPEHDFSKLEDALCSRPALVIDGLFGIGLNRPLDESWKKFFAAVNESKIPVLAVDVPSGLNAETGQPEGAAIEAAVTLTIGAPKIGLLQPGAWPFVGRLEVAEDVGLIACPCQGELNWTLSGDFAGFPPRRSVAGHKGTFGHLAIIAGSFGFHGAAVLAARAAQRAQPGLITLFPQETVYHSVASQLQAVMVSVWKPDIKLPESVSALLIGPGMAASEFVEDLKLQTRRFWRQLTRDSFLPMVVDASALDWLVPHALARSTIRVVTPHPGEAARMLGKPVQQIQANRPQTVREISRRFGDCWVVLKGHQTLIGQSVGEIFVNSSGNPHLAQGGSGDVLAGFIAGLLAQPVLQADVGKTLRYAVW
ncbi:MAG TPA: NAD(P)H-hydrate dehydratase, partial [Candidatus Saccharimonadales bacterium]|nr:NAD(P)H-hydrate dehydratase [Candidatus Saccharimonadales bacterium]